MSKSKKSRHGAKPVVTDDAALVEGGAETAKPAKADKSATPQASAKAAKTAKPAKQPKSSGRAAKPNIFARLGRYFSDVRAEMGRVVWPTRPDVVNASIVVITTLVIFIVLIFLYDQLFTLVINQLAKIGS